jgi:ribonucleoside-diphosphate reductase beta chain
MHWVPKEVPLHEDIKDWNQKLSSREKNLLTQIFRFFTQADVSVAEGYFDKIIPLFPMPELRMMLGSFANMEAVHQHAYSLLLDTVGMPEVEYRAFQEYSEMAEKHDYLQKFNPKALDFSIFKREIAKTLAVYSAFTEGMQLFSSFVILLNFPRFGKMKGMGQIVSWSIRDESLHVEGMTHIFRTFIEENREIWTDSLKREIYDIARKMVELEDRFIDLAFSQGDIEGLKAEDVKTYIRYICDRRLLQIGLKPNYGQKENPLDWVDWITAGVEHANFFEQRATEYGKGTLQGSWSDVWRK